MKPFRPMLASPADLDALRFPLYASPKLDGIRALVRGGSLVSRKLLLIPNKFVQTTFAVKELEGLDGELIMGCPTDDDVYRRTNSAVMAHEGEPRVTFYAFDHHDHVGDYESRMQACKLALDHLRAPLVKAKLKNSPLDVVWHEQTLVRNRDELDAFEAVCVDRGYEGVITRDPCSHYKHGRSTANEQIMLKVKRFEDSEAVVLGVVEEMFNGNAAQKDELGRTKRSKAKAGLVGKGTMGALQVRDLKTGVEFEIGSGFTAEDRRGSWPIDTIVKYSYFPVGVKDKPRHPVYKGTRSRIDL